MAKKSGRCRKTEMIPDVCSMDRVLLPRLARKEKNNHLLSLSLNILLIREEISLFQCDRCGLCCRNLANSALYAELDRGDGTCIYFDCSSKLCTIYERRPMICNVDEMYAQFFHDQMSKKDYYERNYAACRALKNDMKQKETAAGRG